MSEWSAAEFTRETRPRGANPTTLVETEAAVARSSRADLRPLNFRAAFRPSTRRAVTRDWFAQRQPRPLVCVDLASLLARKEGVVRLISWGNRGAPQGARKRAPAVARTREKERVGPDAGPRSSGDGMNRWRPDLKPHARRPSRGLQPRGSSRFRAACRPEARRLWSATCCGSGL